MIVITANPHRCPWCHHTDGRKRGKPDWPLAKSNPNLATCGACGQKFYLRDPEKTPAFKALKAKAMQELKASGRFEYMSDEDLSRLIDAVHELEQYHTGKLPASLLKYTVLGTEEWLEKKP